MWLWSLVGWLLLFLSHFLVDSTGAVTLPVEHKGDEDGPNTESPIDQHDIELIRRALINYDRDIAPIVIGKPLVVCASAKVLSAPSFKEEDGTLALELEMEQCWVDSRLDVHNSEILEVSHEMAPYMWSPHLIFYSTKTPHVHSVFYHNVKHVIHPGGQVVQTFRITVHIYCRFSYTDFPWDHRRCELTFGSSLSAKKIRYKWRKIGFPFEFHKEALEPISDFKFSLLRLSEGHINTDRGLNYSTVTAVSLASRIPFHIVSTYNVILTLIVCSSWAPSYIKDNLAARVIAGVAVFGIAAAWVRQQPLPTKYPVSSYTSIRFYSDYCLISVGVALLHTVFVIVIKHRENKLEEAACRRRAGAGGQEASSSRQLERSKRFSNKLDRGWHILAPITLLLGIVMACSFQLLMGSLADDKVYDIER